MPFRQSGHHRSIGFFRKWIKDITRSQAGLYMSDRYLIVEARKGSTKNCRRVPLHEYGIWLFRLQYFIDCMEHSCGKVRKGLFRTHKA